MQLASTAFEPTQYAPPPLVLVELESVEGRVPPQRNVNPDSVAPLVTHAQRTEVDPGSPASHNPCITVAVGPFTLLTVTALSSATRFVRSPAMTLPPVK